MPRKPWFARAAVWSTLPVPCWKRKTRLRCLAFLRRHPDFPVIPLAERLAAGTAGAEQRRLPVADAGPARNRRVLRRGAGAGRVDLPAQGAGCGRHRDRRGACRGMAQHLPGNTAGPVSGAPVGVAAGGALRCGDPWRHRRDGRDGLGRRRAAAAAGRASSASPRRGGRGTPRSAASVWPRARSRRFMCWTTGGNVASAGG